jgi:hypothetical protein
MRKMERLVRAIWLGCAIVGLVCGTVMLVGVTVVVITLLAAAL